MNNSAGIPGFAIRKATCDDVSLVLSFIHEIAEYERLRHEVAATEEILRESLFGERAYAEVIIGELDGKPAAYAVFFHNFSTFAGRPGLYLEDLYVKPEYRRQGLGRVLLVYLAALARERKCARFEWVALDWNEPALNFYAGLGAQPLNEWVLHRASGEALEKLAEEGEGYLSRE